MIIISKVLLTQFLMMEMTRKTVRRILKTQVNQPNKTKYTDSGSIKITTAVKASDANSVSVKPRSYIATSLSDPFTTSDIPTSLLGSSSSGSGTTTAYNSSGFKTLK